MGRILVASIGCLVVAAAVSCSAANNDMQSRLLDEHNASRADKGVDRLTLDEHLCAYAQRHAEKMASQGLLVHSSMSSLAAVLGNGNVAENIAWGQHSEEEVCRSWMKSPSHRTNMMSKRYKKVGFGVKEDERGRKYWCAVFSS